MPRVVHFEISVDDMERAKQFYSTVFDWKFHTWDGPQEYLMAVTGADDQPGIDGGLIPRQGDMQTVNTLDVSNIDEYIAKVTTHGGEIVVPKMAVPGVGYLAYAKDTENNIFGMMQSDESAH